MSITAKNLNTNVEFDCPFRVTPGGEVVDADKSIYAPTVVDYCDVEGQSLDPQHPEVNDDDWEFVDGFSGQQGYSGPVMHASEQLGGGIATFVMENPGVYCIVVVEADVEGQEGFDNEPSGWALMHYTRPPNFQRSTDHRGMVTTQCYDCHMMVILFDLDEHDCDVTGTSTDLYTQAERDAYYDDEQLADS